MRRRLGRDQILRKQEDFKCLFQKGKRLETTYLKLLWVQSHSSEISTNVKVGFAVPKKQLRLATDRNTIKRRLREAYRKNNEFLLSQLLKNKRSLKLIFLYNTQEKLSYQAIEDEIILSLQLLLPKIES